MITMGDEVRRTQRGNNNAYCQDNEISWYDWSLTEKHADLRRFFTLLAAHRVRRDSEHELLRLSLNEVLRRQKPQWHGIKPGQPDWSEWSHSVALSLRASDQGAYYYAMFNAYHEPLAFELPPPFQSTGPWRRWIDTSLNAPDDIVEIAASPEVRNSVYRIEARTVAVLVTLAEP